MAFPTALSATEVDYLSTMQFSSDCYLLVWGNPVIFAARVNQATFTGAFATITFDTVTVGAYTDAIEGYTVFLSTTNDIRAAYWWGRLRSASTATLLKVEYTSIAPANNDYIFVIKDVRPGMKQPYSDGTLADYEIAYRSPPPVIYDLSTVYFAQIDANGVADVVLAPEARAITSGATISSWAWGADGGSFQVGSTSTQDVTLRYTTEGYYMPRLTVTDSGGRTSWFSPFVFVAPADLSSIAQLRFEDMQISGTVNTGWNTTVPFFDGVQHVMDSTQCAIYTPHNTGGNKVVFEGRIRTEDTDYSADGFGTATFTIEGIAQQMNNLRTISWRYENKVTSTTFNHITNLTPWRFVGAYIRELTNLNNTHSLSFDDVTNTYLYLSYFMQEGTLLDSLRDQLWSVNNDLEFSSDGMIKLVRNARYLTTAARTALTTIANFSFANYSGAMAQDVMYGLELDHSLQVGKSIMGMGWYNSTSNDVSVVIGTTPTVLPARGVDNVATDRQILAANLSRANAEVEAKQRTRNDFAAKQHLDTITIQLPGAYIGKLNPSISQLYTHTITVADGIRLLTYDTGDWWLLTDVTIGYSKAFGMATLDCTFQIESEDLGFAVDIQDPPPATYYNVPVLPPMSGYPNLPIDYGLTLPDGATAGDEQPITKKDKEKVEGAKDPAVYYDSGGNILLGWYAGSVHLTTNLALTTTNPTWLDVTPQGITGTIQECVWDRDADSHVAAYCLTNDGTDSYIYYNPAVGQIQTWQSTTLTGIVGTSIRVNKKDNVVIYGIAETYAPVGGSPLNGLNTYGGTNDLSGDGTADIVPSTHASLSQPATEFPGVYNSTYQRFQSSADPVNGGVGCTVEWAIPPGVRITAITCRIDYYNPIAAAEGYKRSSIEGDTEQYGSVTTLALGTSGIAFTATVNMPIEPGTQSKLYFNAAVNKNISFGTYIHINGIQITGTFAADWAVTRLSADKGDTFAAQKSVGVMALGAGSFEVRYNQTGFAAMDEKVRKATLVGLGYADETNGAVPAGQYPKALWHFGRTTDDYLIAPDGGAKTLIKAVEGVGQTDLTANLNDGAADGIVVGPGGLAMSNISEDYIWFLGSFGGSYKLAYSTDLGATWAYNTTPTSAATWVSVNPRNLIQVYIADDATVYYSQNGGSTLIAKTAPAAGLLGVAAL